MSRADAPSSFNAHGVQVAAREGPRNPLSSNCAMHLRRICGVCVHFTGTMRGDGTCNKHKVDTSGPVSARDCVDWRRK